MPSVKSWLRELRTRNKDNIFPSLIFTGEVFIIGSFCDNLVLSSYLEIRLFSVLGDDEAAEGFVVFGGWGGKGSVPFLEPFVVFDGVA